MSQYRYLASDLITGQVNGDWLPLTTDSFGRAISDSGTCTTALNLTAGTPAEGRTWRDALEPGACVLWAFMDGVPVWNGIAWDQPHQSVLDGTLPVTATTMESLFSHRYILDDLTFTDQDIFAIFRSLAVYALGKPSGGVAGLNLGTNLAGVTDTISYAAADEAQILQAWTDLTAQYGFEFSFRPGFDASGNLATFLDLGCPQLGLQYPASGLAYAFPGEPARLPVDPDPVLGRQRRHRAPPPTRRRRPARRLGVGVSARLRPGGPGGGPAAAGVPATLSTVDRDLPGPDRRLRRRVPAVGDGDDADAAADPRQRPGPRGVADIVLGSWAQVALTSPLHPANADGSPGWQGQGRITGWTVYPPQSDSQPEYTELQFFMPDESGVTG